MCVRAFLSKLRRSLQPRDKLIASVSTALPDLVCVDVGASYFPHGNWDVFLRSPNTQWCAVEPNKENLGYLSSWHFPSHPTPFTVGLSETGGLQTLYVTHVDTGSSLFPPVITPGMEHRIQQAVRDYFFPMKEVQIQTQTLAQVINTQPDTFPVFVKLDTQGSELSILRGAESLVASGRVLGIEMESTLLAQPLMQGSGKFWEACAFLEPYGYELLFLKQIQAESNYTRSPKGNRYLNECDAVFAIRRDIVALQPVPYRAALFGFYISYNLYEEALSFLQTDLDLRQYFENHGASAIVSLLQKLI